MNDVLFTIDVTVFDFVLNCCILASAIATGIALIISHICDKVRNKRWELERDAYFAEEDDIVEEDEE